MNDNSFIDYYEILQISPNAHADTIDRVFRYFAQRYHPDNQDTGDVEHFKNVVRAHETLIDPVKRAQFDHQYKAFIQSRWHLKKALNDDETLESDLLIQHRILSLLYLTRRRNMGDPGLGTMAISDILDLPYEKLKFHIWFLKEKRWITRTENGLLAITVEGIEKVQGLKDNSLLNPRITFEKSHK
jgi:curved DNA-binding protein CbpA